MEMVLKNGFCDMTQEEMLLVDGGGILGNVVKALSDPAVGKALAGVGGCLLIVAGGVSVIVGVGVAVGTGGTATVPGIKLAGAGVSGIVAGAKILDSVFK